MKSLKYFFLLFLSAFFNPLFCLLFMNVQLSWAQTNERFTIDYLQLSGSNGVSTSSVSGSFSHRFFLDDEGSNLLTLTLSSSQVELTDNTLSEPDRSRQLRFLVPEINLLKVLNDKYSLVGTLKPGFFGDLRGNLSDEFRLEGGLVLTRFMNENLTLGVGLGRGANFGRDLVVPLVQFLYFASDKIVLRGLLPVNASVWYIPSQTWEFGVLYKLQGSVFHLDETNISGAERIGFAAAQIGLGSKYKVTGNYYITAEVGFTALRRYEWDDENTTSFEIGQIPFFERQLGSVPYINLGLIQKF